MKAWRNNIKSSYEKSSVCPHRSICRYSLFSLDYEILGNGDGGKVLLKIYNPLDL